MTASRPQKRSLHLGRRSGDAFVAQFETSDGRSSRLERSKGYETGNPLEQTANTGHIAIRRRRRPTNGVLNYSVKTPPVGSCQRKFGFDASRRMCWGESPCEH